MNTFTIWLPYFICLLIVTLYIVALKKKLWKAKNLISGLVTGFLVLGASVIVVLLVGRATIVDATPTPGWEIEARKTKVAILFGFGYEEDNEGNMLPGAANLAIYQQAMADANYQYLIMQEGVMSAARDDSVHAKIQMHPLSKYYVNTFEAALYAIRKMDSLKVKKAVVYAHNQQLARAVYILKGIAASNPRWQDMEFIIPYIPPTPYPCHSVQPHTRCELIYLPIELFISRPRDYLK